METYTETKRNLMMVPVPEETRTYKPITHAELIDLTLSSIYRSGFTLDTELYTSSNGGKVANGRFTIKDVRDSEMQLQIGWQNSYDKSRRLKFAIGTKIFICDNGCVHGDFGSFGKKHMGEIMEFTPSAITSYIKKAGDVFEQMQKERDAMKEIEINKRIQAELIGRMFVEEQFIKSTQLNIILGEIERPTHDYGCHNSLWELYNYTTFAMKELHPSLWMDNHIKAHKFFTNYEGIDAPHYVPEIEVAPINQLELFDEVHESSVLLGVDNVQ